VQADCRVLIDQGGSVAQAKQLQAEIGIDRIYLTHWHEDHALSAGALQDVPVHVPVQDQEPVRSRKAAHARGGVEKKEIADALDQLYDAMGWQHREVDAAVAPDGVVDLGGVLMQALFVPGHTSGHTCYWFPEEGLVVLGDYDLTRTGPVCPDVDSNVRDTYASLARLGALPVKRAVSAHGRGWFHGEEYRQRLASYVRVLDDRLETIVRLVKNGENTLDKLGRRFTDLFQFPNLGGYEAWAELSGHMLLRPCMRYLVEEGRLGEIEPGRYEPTP
jgi:glyoxylase-like metal-dependent hydrolase (beta-lactamase superfamily II)